VGIRAAVAGATGYAGGEVLRLLAGHPEFEIGPVTANTSAGDRLGALQPHLPDLVDRVVEPTSPRALAGADLVFLALPHGASAPLAAQLPAELPIVDLGSDHRLADPAAYASYYGGDHPGAWTYGLPELRGQRVEVAAATRVAGTGCHAVAAILALAPLVAADLIDRDDVVITSVTGTSGAGRKPEPHLLGAEVMGDLSPYSVGAHRHVPEILQATGLHSLSFTPVLAPLPRGILLTASAKPARSRLTAEALREVLARAYTAEPFLHVLPEGRWPHTKSTLGTNACHLQATVDAGSGRITVCAAIDNLGKGTAGQAIQCANLMLGLNETAGLTASGVAP
jgi:N-acetyl-gamma-glutamyl-phosphate reductase